MKWLMPALVALLVAGCGSQTTTQPPPLQRFESLRGEMAQISGLAISVSRQKAAWDRAVSAGRVSAVRTGAVRLRRLALAMRDLSSRLAPAVLRIAQADVNAAQRRYLTMVGTTVQLDGWEARDLAHEASVVWLGPWLVNIGAQQTALRLDRASRHWAWLARLEAIRLTSFHRAQARAFRFVPVASQPAVPALEQFLPGFK